MAALVVFLLVLIILAILVPDVAKFVLSLLMVGLSLFILSIFIDVSIFFWVFGGSIALAVPLALYGHWVDTRRNSPKVKPKAKPNEKFLEDINPQTVTKLLARLDVTEFQLLLLFGNNESTIQANDLVKIGISSIAEARRSQGKITKHFRQLTGFEDGHLLSAKISIDENNRLVGTLSVSDPTADSIMLVSNKAFIFD